MKAMVMIQHPQERMLVTQGLQASGVAVQQVANVASLEPGWGMEAIDLVILATVPEQAHESVRQIRMVSAATIIVIADLIEEKDRMALYLAGADMVFARPYSLRFLLMQAGTIAHRVGGTRWPQPSVAPMNPLAPKTWLPS
ncbi:MAG: hypothetical protein U0350_11525 [Caldilineaceae bacterium]